MRLSETDRRIDLFHFNKHGLICGSRDETLAPDNISPASICFTSSDHINLLDILCLRLLL